ncbi:hypothetical protein [Aeromonas veronii]|uniref:hypothetical protein n=1 Tax=Aeromonas veronii TaxID=654 RepID=UPI000EB5AAB4|nr:hypothetical protein [Aeromonas veronii]AYK20432.1 hypothetical protein C0073_021950 [Aeromonas veronii]
MMDADDILNIVTFLGDEMTDEQAQRLMDQAKSCCSIADMERIKDAVGGPSTPCSQSSRAKWVVFTGTERTQP